MQNNGARNGGSIILGVLLIGLGSMLLLSWITGMNPGQFLWPFYIIVPGLLFFIGMVLGGKPAGPLAIPGSIVTMVGLILLYANTFNHFEVWAYAWSLIFPTAVGIGLVINGTWSDTPNGVTTGMRMVMAGLAIFALGGIFFEAFLGISDNRFPAILFSLLIIAVGLWQIFGRGSASTRPASEGQPPVPIEQAPKKAEPTFEPLDMTRGSRK